MAVGMADFEGDDAGLAAQKRYVAAVRHSGRVRWLRRMIPVGAVLLVGLVAFWAFYEPFKVLPEGVSIGAVQINGSKVTMELPKLNGFKKDNRPYQVTARWAEQDLKNPSVIGLREVKAEIVLQDRSTARVEALNGTYDTHSETMVLKDDVRVRTETGYDVRMRSAEIEFKGGNVTTADPVSVAFQGGTIQSDSLQMFDSGQRVVFAGRVKTVMHAGVPGAKAGPSPATTATPVKEPTP